jgi:hypothetical protein
LAIVLSPHPVDMKSQNAFHHPLPQAQVTAADDSEAHMLRRFHRWHEMSRAIRDAAVRDDLFARLDLALQRTRL